MEPNMLASEDSIDSIPGPTYERIIVTKSSLKSGATNSTSIAEDEDVEMEGEEYSEGNEDHIDPVQIQNGRGELERDQADVEGDDGSFLEDDCGERDDYKENEHQIEQVELNALEVAAVAAAAATELPSEQTSNKSVVVDKKTPIAEEPAVDHARICPMPVQIVSGLIVKPNILPMKTKSNKIIMAPQINDQAAEGSTGAILCSSTGQPSNSGHKIVGGAESMISDADKLQPLNEGKLTDSLQQQQNARFLARSSTPLSREFLALQRSVNESKVLSEFVTDPVRKRQKNAPKDSTEQTIPQQQQQNNHHHHHHHHHGEKHRKSGKFAPLKDDSGSSNSSILARRSRSKSVNRKSEDILDASGGKLNRWPSDEKMLKRTNMRSQNSEFVQKQMEFLSRVKHDEGEVSSEADDGERSFVNGGEEDDLNLVVEQNAMNECNVSAVGLVGSMNSLSDVSLERECVGNIGTSPKVDSVEARLLTYWAPPPKRGWDCFCWKCRECVDLFPCSKCVRCFHCTCIKVTSATKLDDTWVCPECLNVDNVLNGPKRNSRRAEISLDLLSQLLSFALKRMKMVKGYSKFLYTDRDLLHYSKYIANPVTFTTLQEKVEKRAFRCAEEFLNETKWILHNALILSSGSSSKEVFTAKAILKVCRQETNEIDTCAECYLNANTRTDWFVDVCSQPHLLLWAKLKGFPYWPAKAMGPGQGLSHVNVRFFGEHDRAFVPVKDCFLYSEQDPNTQTGKRSARELADCIKEVEVHIEKIKSKVGTFKYAKFKTPYEPMDELQQLEMMIPGVTEYMKRQQALVPKPSLQYKIVKTADNHLSIIKKASTTESGNDSDHSVSPHKKASSTAACISGGSSGASDAKTTVVTPKYEVVSKASSDDSNSSKVTAVILKRKSSTEHKKEANDELELPMPKMIKFDEEADESGQLANTNTTDHANATAEQITADTTGKRKNVDDPCDGSTNTNCSSIDGVASMETAGGQRTKYAKYEPRVPMITIKTNVKELGLVVCPETKSSSRSSATNPNNSMSAIISTETKISNSVKEEVAVAASLTPITTHSSNNNAQTLMENLVKNKHGVTIKKISKEGLKKPEESTNSTNVAGTGPITDETQPSGPSVEKKSTDTTADPAIETPQDVAVHKKNPVNDTNPIKEADTSNSITKNSERNLKGTAKSATNTHILKDLVPFVEIKKEITSDDEAETQPAPDMDIQNNKQKDVVATTTPSTVQTLQAIVETPLQESLPATSTPSVEPNLSLVKQEVMSDEEEAVGVPYSTASISSSQQEVNTSSTLGDVAVDNQSGVMTTNLLPDAVRVGETMIHRVNTKNLRNSQPSLVALKPVEKATQESGAVMDGLTPGSSAMHVNQPNKRPNTRGVPYGPLPASAIITQQSQPPKSVASGNTANRMILQQQQQQQLSQSQSQTQTQSSSQTQSQSSSQTSPQSTSQVQSESSQAPLQRARKSFPNRSTPDISTIRGNGSNLPLPPPALPPPITSSLTNNNDLKRTLLKNSMVSIPRQAWSPHDQQRNTNIVISNTNTNSIPVPPLTAVSKTSTALTVLSNNSSPSVNSNMNTNMAINTTPIATTFVTCNGTIGPNGPALLTPLTMSAPPPLAGLSQSSSNMIATPAVAAITTNMPLFDVNTNNSVSTGSGNITLSSTVELATQQAGTSSSTSGVASTSSGDLVTPSFTAMVTDAICRGPPKMVQRPNGPLKSDGTTMFPSQAGPVCQTLVENAHKLTDFFISVMEDTMLEMSLGEEPVLQAKITLLKMELERTKQAYEQEIAELKRTSDLMICEMRKSMENEKTRISNEIRKQCEQERLRSIDETKKKQWCSNCGREAQFYCCWNTSYCDYPCQQMHWSRHSATCAQTRPTIASASDSLAKTVSTMTTTVSAMGLQQQQQQQQQQLQQTGCGSKNASNMMAVTNPTSMNVSQHNYNKNTLSNKKEKQKVNHQQSVANSMGVSSTGNNSMASIAAGVSVPTGAPTELLKLPSNTYLRTVTQGGSVGNNNNGGGGNMRGSTYSVQRVNIPLPITALVQRGNSWELTSAAPNSNSGAANMAALTAPGSNLTQAMTQMAPPQQQQQQQQHQQHRMMSGSGTTSNISMGRSNSRNRAAAAAAQAMQQTMATMHNTTSGTATSMPCGMMRPTQM